MEISYKYYIMGSIATLLLTLIAILLPLKVLFSTSLFYEFEIKNLQLDRRLSMSSNELLANYKAIIRYVTTEPSSHSRLTLPSFEISSQGEAHFKDVQILYALFNKVLLTSVLSFVFILLILYRMGYHYAFLQWTAYALSMILFLLFLAMTFQFELLFISFHQLLFNNDHWIFDPLQDPIIHALPQEFFLHCGLFVCLMILASVFLFTCLSKLRHSSK